MAGTIGTELFMVQLKHVRNEKYQESSIELHPDRNINNLNGIVSKNGQYKFLTTPSGYKWDINHIDRNQAILLEVLKGFRYYGWRLLTSHAFNSSSGIELVVETDYIFEINVDDYFHVIDTLFGDTNSAQIHSNGVDYSKYAVYETKSSDQRSSNTPTAAGARRPSDSNTLNKDFHHEPHNHALAHHESPSSRSGKSKGPANAEYAAMLLDTTVNPQAGPYGFTRLHNIQTNNVMTPKARMEKKEAALAEAQSKKLTSPSISSAVSPVAAQQTPDVEKVRLSISSPEHTAQSSVAQSPAVQHHQPNVLLEAVSSTPRSSIRRVSNGVTFAENIAADPESSLHTQPAVALSPVVEAEETHESSQKPVDIPAPIAAPIAVVPEVVKSSVVGAAPVIRAAPPVPTRATNTAEADLTVQTTPIRDIIAEKALRDQSVTSQAAEVVQEEISTARSAAESDAVLAPAVSSVEVAGVTSPNSSASSSSNAVRRPSTNSSSAADKLFQKYSHRKSFTNGSKSPAASFSSPDTAATAHPASSGTGSTHSEPMAAKVSLSIVTGSEPSAEPAKPATSAAANKLFQKYNQHKKPTGAHSQSSNKLVVAPESAAPQAATNEAAKEEAKVAIKNDSVVAPSATPVVSTPPQPRKSLSNLFGGLPPEQSVPEEVVVAHSSAEVVESPKAVAAIPDTMLVHHSQLQAEGRGEVRRSIGGFRRVKSIISVSRDEEEDYGDVNNIKVIENGTEQDAAVLPVNTKADPTPDPIGASRTTSASPSHDKPPLIPVPVPRKSFIGMLQKTKTPNLNVDPFASDQLRRSGDDEDYGDLSRIQTIELGDEDEDSGLDMSAKTGSAKRSPMHIATNGIAAPVSPLVSPVEKKLLSTPSMFVSPDAMELLRKPVDNSTDEEKAASAIHENSRTNHYAKLGSAFVSEKILSAGRGGRGRGAGRGGGIR